MKERIGTVGRLALFKDEDGLGVEPIDPRDDLVMTLRFLRWAIGVLLWVGRKISARRALDDAVVEQLVARAKAEGRVTVI